MTRIQELKQEVRKLAPSELAAFRKWFEDFDSDQWDSQIPEDALTGKNWTALPKRPLRITKQERPSQI